MKDHIEKYDFSAAISPIEEIVEEARNGRMYILVDAEDRENEGDLIIPAQFATPAQVNFMAKHGRGLICLSVTRDRARTLELDMMARENRESMKTAFTVSIEAKEGVTTGISAHDRAHTIAVAIDPTKNADDIVSPGHVFPLVAKEGGVLVRAGHTEASVDISRLAGLYPAWRMGQMQPASAVRSRRALRCKVDGSKNSGYHPQPGMPASGPGGQVEKSPGRRRFKRA